MSNKTRLRQAEKTAAKRPFTVGGYEPPVLRQGGTPREVEEILLFSVVEEEPGADGEPIVHEYYVPTAVSRAFSLRTLELEASRGPAASTTYALRGILGADGYEALQSEDNNIDGEAFDAIIEAVMAIALGEAGKR